MVETFFSSQKKWGPYRLWGPSGPLFNGHHLGVGIQASKSYK
jgi:hypothetical protein